MLAAEGNGEEAAELYSQWPGVSSTTTITSRVCEVRSLVTWPDTCRANGVVSVPQVPCAFTKKLGGGGGGGQVS